MAGGFKLPPGLLAIMSVDVGGDGGAGGGGGGGRHRERSEETRKEFRTKRRGCVNTNEKVKP